MKYIIYISLGLTHFDWHDHPSMQLAYQSQLSWYRRISSPLSLITQSEHFHGSFTQTPNYWTEDASFISTFICISEMNFSRYWCICRSCAYRDRLRNTLHWRHNECDGVSNHWRLHCLLICWCMRKSKKTSKLCVTGLCGGGIHRLPVNSPHQRPVTRKMFPFDDVVMNTTHLIGYLCSYTRAFFIFK